VDLPDKPRALRLKRPREVVEAFLRTQTEDGLALVEQLSISLGNEGWQRDMRVWRTKTQEGLRALFDSDRLAEDFMLAARSPGAAWTGKTLTDELSEYRSDLRDGVTFLEGLVASLDFAEGPTAALAPPDHASAVGNEVFVVHGRDRGVRAEVEALLRRLDLEPIILEDRPNKGLPTVIEKLERETLPTGYAIVILSPEDWRRGAGEEAWPDGPNSARENVLIELGYFIGKLDRDHVTALHKLGAELPSDVLGVAYTPLDDGGAWRYKIANELREAGYDVDLNKL
jgi:predicted nucleotide-binding protein